jgi:small-conductance mechanosensitive channel
MVLAALWLSVLLTFSRGILGFIASAAIRNARTPARKKVAAATAVACVVLVISATVWKPKVDPSRPLETRFEQHPSSRLQAAKSSLLTLVAHPLFGSGLNTSPGIYQGAPFDAHFTLLNIAAALGLPALIAFSFLIGALWRSRRRPTDLAVWGGLAGLAVDALAQDVEDFRHVWVMIGTADAETRAKRIEATD